MKLFINIFIILLTEVAICQNLVPNSSFELLKISPQDGLGNMQLIRFWYNPSNGSPEVLDNRGKIDNNLIPTSGRTGNYNCKLAIFSQYNVEYIASPLKNPLIPNEKYYVELWVNYSKEEIRNLPKEFGLKFYNKKIDTKEIWLKGKPNIYLISRGTDDENDWVKYLDFILQQNSCLTLQ